ncbi:hypothetical protein [Pseudooceanicola sp. MF1-13]|uniref:hypothetical protein n=1 Tax=Pseudooceanicola sp. MF1-13 TaxID=3379095 RepID=UPI003892A49A
MLTDSTGSNTGVWGGLSASVKTMAMGTAGVALWGSLAFYFVSGPGDTTDIDTVQASERLFLRMELPETALLDGCAENSGATCGDKAWVIISENRERARQTVLPVALVGKVPPPLWTEVVARHSMNEPKCRDLLEEELPKWLSSGSRAKDGLHATLVPDRFTTCKGQAADIDPNLAVQAYWIMDGPQVVAEMRCTMPGGSRASECQLTAYPEHGDFVVSYSRLPAKNAGQIVDQSARMLGVLEANLPESAQGSVDLAFLDGQIAFDDASAHAVASLQNMAR